ncbi:hypothetical protein FISHEDRAFT_75949 [Fistulina hepatica ATCC 64428]|uniref:EH domain-containing protein n=1 Tax=Fistulina hepatica ATCC 64428 TaxID=1128425 RepID=A0A0D7A6V2_9AGAR|nr:hypothetical protein FISHEDRAFT_75949 [Fistulina hepatica ATCC 64428]
MRKLSLHVSALSNEEYNDFTSCLTDLTGTPVQPSYDETQVLSVREVRAWMRGRYTGMGSQIDEILKFFSPDLGPAATMSAGEFFAALRLVRHCECGKGPDRNLVFTASLTPSSSPKTATVPLSRSRTNPFTSSSTDRPPPLHPLARTATTKSISSSSETLTTQTTPRPPHSSHNPFFPPTAPLPVPAKNMSSSQSESNNHYTASKKTKLPPLPPRKPANMRGNPSAADPSSISTLMKQSLQASKTGQTMKRAEEMLEKERILSVLKSSSKHRETSPNKDSRSVSPHREPIVYTSSVSSGASASTSGSSNQPPKLPYRPQKRQVLPSPPASASSLQEVALAGSRPPRVALNSRSSSSSSRVLDSRSTSSSPTRRDPPPTHPLRKAPTTAPISGRRAAYEDITPTEHRPARSQSFSSRFTDDSAWRSERRRPESMQMLGGQRGALDGSSFATPSDDADSNSSSPSGLSRHMSLSSSTSGASRHLRQGSLNLANLSLNPEATDIMQQLRFKAEAGIAPRRGFVRHDRAGQDEDRLLGVNNVAPFGQRTTPSPIEESPFGDRFTGLRRDDSGDGDRPPDTPGSNFYFDRPNIDDGWHRIS